MAMAVDNRQQMTGLPYDPMRYNAPHFTNPWASAQSAPSGQMYAPMSHGVATADQARHHSTSMATSSGAPSMSYPAAAALPSLQMQSGAQPMDSMYLLGQNSQVQAYAPRPYVPDYSSAASSSAAAYPAMTVAAPQYNAPVYAPVDQSKLSAFGGYPDRRASHPSVASAAFFGSPLDAAKYRTSSLIDTENRLQTVSEAERNSFSDALDASRGMVAMSQDITPRNIYGNQGSARSSTDSYGFPSTHSAHSSISSASTYPSYYGSSVSESSYGDYSSASESIDGTSRTLPRPMGATMPPAPQSMMGQFSSKVASSSQKKHKCKICEKRFTRPSSLQTHMYSHTGEKPFACDAEGCGRHFSVVSNLRRHKKVHKGGSDHGGSDDELD